MQLINIDGELRFIADENETEANHAFLARMRQYTMKVNGAMVLVYDQQKRLISCIKPFDNTQFICAADGYQLAADFGAKRFLAGEALKAVNDEIAQQNSVIKFARDLAFPIEARATDIMNFETFDLAGIERRFRVEKTKLYESLAELFNRCANFTPGKQEEYLTGGKLEDKYCRFNLENNQDKTAPSTNQVFLVNAKNDIVGTISATVIQNEDNTLDIYLYDEVVDYFRLLTAEAAAKVYVLNDQLGLDNDAARKAALEKEIAAIIEPERTAFMRELFAAARRHLRKDIVDLDERIAKGQVRAFIRAAADRVDAYVELGCSKTNTNNFVIHGPALTPMKMLDAHVKSWAQAQLKSLQPKASPVSILARKHSATDVGVQAVAQKKL